MLWQLLYYYFFLLLIFCPTIIQSDSGCSNQQNEVNLEERKRFNNAFPFLDTLEDVFTIDNDDGIYIGELFNCSSGIKHGWGEMRWANGTLYGPNNIFYYSEGDRYYGQWNLDLQEGIGSFESQTGIYIGEWKRGLQNGNGTAIYNNGNRYIGQFKDGFKSGYGKFQVNTIGDVYEGEFRNGLRNGQGIERYGSTGEIYVGNFVNDTRDGIGTAYYQDGGPKYIGTWVNGNPEGSNGTLFLQNGQKYVGSFALGSPFGEGILYGPDGIIIKNGTFGTSNEQSANEQPQFNNNDGGLSGLGLGDLGGLPRILNNLNLANNKYTNLLRKIADFAGLKLPFR